MYSLTTDRYTLTLQGQGLPYNASTLAEKAMLNDRFECEGEGGEWSFLAVGLVGSSWPFLTLTHRYSPSGYGFEPGAILIPETELLLVGAGEDVFAYDLVEPRRLWQDAADVGFWGWARFGQTVLMEAELELAAWNLRAEKLWSTYVEPPWGYEVKDGVVHLDVMGTKSSFDLEKGP